MRLAPLLAFALLAGCAGVEPEGSRVEAAASPLLAELGAIAGEATTSRDALVLPLRAVPAGAIAAAWWTVPEGLEREVDGEAIVALMGAPVVAGGAGAEAAVERWFLVTFTEEADGLAVGRFAFGVPLTATRGSEEQVTERSMAPFPFMLASGVSPGDRIGIVLAAVAREPVDMAVVLARAASGAMPETSAEFLRATDAAARIALPTTTVEAPHMFTLLQHMTAATGDAQELSTGTATASGTTRGIGTIGLREVRVENAFPHRGYSFSFAAYSNDAGAGEWSARFDMHGEESASAGEVRNVAGTPLEDVPLAAAAGEGEAPATGVLTASVTSAAGSDALTYFSLDLGATLTELLGVAPAPVEPGDVTMGALAASFNDLAGCPLHPSCPFRA